MASCYRKLNDLESAKNYLQKAIKISYDNRGLSYLNLCAIMSQLGDHGKALSVGGRALKEVTSELDRIRADLLPSQKQPPPVYLKNLKLQAIAHYNCGVEQEYLQLYQASYNSFRKSYQVFQEILGSRHPLT